MAVVDQKLRERFFVTGGTIPAGSGSYVERSADRDLLEHILAGRFCYVLNSRQMGKSSLCVRTMRRLEEMGVRCAFVDLTKIGGRNVTPEQWYAGVGTEIARSLGLRADLLQNWKANQHLSPVQRLFGALREVVLEQIEGNVVVFFDEIDATRALSFNPDEFFAAIRECYNRRAQDPDSGRLTFCLLGVAVPSDLINSPTSTPFNVGDRVYLRDFTLDEAMCLADGLPGPNSRSVLERVYHWTNGHPYLTQSLCAAAAQQGIDSPQGVDELVRRDLFDPKARETNINLADVGNRALHAGDLEPDPEKFRADLLSAYQRAWNGRPLADDESNRVAALLKMSGMMRSEGSRLYVRNRIYLRVFDRAWVRENMPGQELRRQKRAFWLGVLRTTAISACVVAVIGILAWNNLKLAELAESRRKLAEYRLYVSDVNLMQSAFERGDLVKLDILLGQTATSPYRNLEWRYWLAKLNDTTRRTGFPYGMGWVNVSPDSKTFGVTDTNTGRGAIYSIADMRRVSGSFPVGRAAGVAVNGGRWTVLDGEQQGTGLFVVKAPGSDEAQGRFEFPKGVINTTGYSPNSNYLSTICQENADRKEEVIVWDARTFRQVADIPVTEAFGWNVPTVSDDGHIVAWAGGTLTERQKTVVYDRNQRKVVDRFEEPSSNNYPTVAITGDGRYLAVGYASGLAVVRDVASHRTIFSRAFPGDVNIAVAISSDGQRLLTAGSNLIAQVWDVPSGKLLLGRPGALNATLTLDGRWLIVCGDGTRVYAVPARAASARRTGVIQIMGECPLGLIGVTPTGIKILNYDDPSRPAMSPLPGSLNSKGKWSATITPSDFVFSAAPNGHFVVYRTTDGRKVCELRAGDVYGVDVNERAAVFATIDHWDHLNVYDLSGKERWATPLQGTYYALSVSSDGKRVAVGGGDGTIKIFDSLSGHQVGTLHNSTGCLYSVAFSHDGTRLATGDINRTVRIFDLKGDSPPIEAISHTSAVYFVEFSPDDSRLLSASADGTARLWDARTGEELLRLGSGDAQIRRAFFGPDGNRIYFGDMNYRVYRYDAPPVSAPLDLLSTR